MPRINIKLVAARDGETGELGLVIKGMHPVDNTVNSATEGLLIAHDVIEHVNGIASIGSITDELEALGAIWYVRGQHNDLSRNGTGSAYTAHENVASDITRMFRDYFYGSYVDFSQQRTRPHDCDADFEDIIRVAEREKEHEFDADEAQRARDKWPEYAALCLHRMRSGYRKAARKWDKLGRYAANSAFWAIAEAVQPHAKRPEFEGMSYKLSYDSNTQRATCEEIYDNEY